MLVPCEDALLPTSPGGLTPPLSLGSDGSTPPSHLAQTRGCARRQAARWARLGLAGPAVSALQLSSKGERSGVIGRGRVVV
ncbi:hypothetical protein PF008_g13678 [Phytophthora fragariae]|uniref:Uncharacterized protein n=1 Tax=Phytophthora fragariae TaxID=53985 RepID=A0A6G0RJ93_9STRA|nr:hypothetical protein PF008_g13678 [Phytophthora fragariae]